MPFNPKRFKLTALRPNGTGVAGALVRILNGQGLDVTAGFFTNPTHGTDTQGVFERSVSLFSAPPPGFHTIQVIASGFDLYSYQTTILFEGSGTYTANLVPVSFQPNYSLTEPANVALSSMVPIVCTVESPNEFDYEFINATVTHPNGNSSVIQAPIDRVSRRATIDIRNRVQLGIRPLLVADTALSREDTDFSTEVEVSFSSVNPEGETGIAGSFTRLVAHTLPPQSKADLHDYTTLVAQRWIVPFEPVVAFRGYYRDVMIWLPVPSLPGYVFRVAYFDRANTEVTTTMANLTESRYVQRIRLDTNPPDGVVRAVLTITSGNDTQTQPLTVLYRD